MKVSLALFNKTTCLYFCVCERDRDSDKEREREEKHREREKRKRYTVYMPVMPASTDRERKI